MYAIFQQVKQKSIMLGHRGKDNKKLEWFDLGVIPFFIINY